jgi:predicted NAD/FAD-dependent oxidoreductase
MTLEEMQSAKVMTDHLVAELRAAGMHDVCIAATLVAAAGGLWRYAIPNEALRRAVVSYAAECAITGHTQP